MKKEFFFITFFMGLLYNTANGQNPYQSIGKPMPKGKMLTLSDGKFQEFFPNDTLVPIGSVMYNTITGQVVAFLTRDTMYAEYNLEPEIVSRWLSPDPLAAKFTKWSPYHYGFDNPVRFMDPDGQQGQDVILKGGEQERAFLELRLSVRKELTLKKDADGKVTYEKIGSGTLSADAQQLVDAIDDHSVVVNVNAENSYSTKAGLFYMGGAFSGNTVTKGTGGAKNTVVAEQEVNPEVLGNVSTIHGKRGANMLHEVTEAYQGGLLSQKSGVSSLAAGGPGSTSTSVYNAAHAAATPQSGPIFQANYDASGKEVPSSSPNIVRQEWFVENKAGTKFILLSSGK
jgi:hypothetical protein